MAWHLWIDTDDANRRSDTMQTECLSFHQAIQKEEQNELRNSGENKDLTGHVTVLNSDNPVLKILRIDERRTDVEVNNLQDTQANKGRKK